MSDRFPDNTIVDILTAEDIEPDWFIPNLAAQGNMIVLAGEPAAGKSYISYTLGLAAAAGCSALGGIVPAGDPRRVLYFDEENSAQERDKYLRRSFYGLGGEDKLDYGDLQDNFWPVHFVLGDEDWIDKAAYYVENIRPHCIVFDTATPCFNIADENNNAEATQAIKGIRNLMRITEPNATAIILKHAKVSAEGGRRMIRGAKAWHSAVDSLLFQVRAPGRPRNDGLRLTRLIPDKVRAYGLPQTLYITPEWTDDARSGLKLKGSYTPDKEHRKAEKADDGEDD